MTIDKVDNNEEEFMLIGLDAFVNIENDKNINWKAFFQLSEEEQFYAVNNNKMIKDDKTEDELWSKYSKNLL